MSNHDYGDREALELKELEERKVNLEKGKVKLEKHTNHLWIVEQQGFGMGRIKQVVTKNKDVNEVLKVCEELEFKPLSIQYSRKVYSL